MQWGQSGDTPEWEPIARSKGEAVTVVGFPHTQVDVALAFPNDRRIIDRHGRCSSPACAAIHVDAMTQLRVRNRIRE